VPIPSHYNDSEDVESDSNETGGKGNSKYAGDSERQFLNYAVTGTERRWRIAQY
jgi:hypothetical protein